MTKFFELTAMTKFIGELPHGGEIHGLGKISDFGPNSPVVSETV